MIDFLNQQIPNGTAAIESEVTQKTLSIMELIVNGGTGGMIIVGTLALLLFVALYVYFERLFAIKAASKYDVNFMNQIRGAIASGNLQAAKLLCVNQGTPVSRLTEKGISRIGSPLEDINTAIENAGRLEVYKLEKNVSVLATIAGAAPMIGFLGTVIGMIVAFHEMASAGGNIDVEMLSKGIYMAMTTTVAGLIVGIIAFIAYNYLVSKVDKVVFMLEAKTTEFLDVLHHNE